MMNLPMPYVMTEETHVADQPVFEFRDRYTPTSYFPDEYIDAAIPVLADLHWLAGGLTVPAASTAMQVLNGLQDLDLDAHDVFPFGLLWALRHHGLLVPVGGLDEQLAAWRAWEETEHAGEPFTFLPPLLPAPDAATARITAGINAMRSGTDPRWHAVAALLAGHPLDMAGDSHGMDDPIGYATRNLPAAAHALAVVDAYLAVADTDMLTHYSQALDEIYRLRGLLAYEADVIAVHLGYATFPKTRRRHAESQVQQMLAAATGSVQQVLSDISDASMRHTRRAHGIETLTRSAWEAENPTRSAS